MFTRYSAPGEDAFAGFKILSEKREAQRRQQALIAALGAMMGNRTGGGGGGAVPTDNKPSVPPTSYERERQRVGSGLAR
jgi:hypothetical protein